MAVRRKTTSGNDGLLKRAHIGAVDNAASLLELAKTLNIRLTPLDVEGLTAKLGIDLKKEPMEREVSGSLSCCLETGVWQIKVNSLHHETRQRFTIAHELGHYMLHKNDHMQFTDTVLFRNDETNTMEHEANQFAGDLLMPEDQFRGFVNTKSRQKEVIAAHFGVSPLAVTVRAQQLGIGQRS